MLVTHSRDHEKSSARWRKMELHDVIVETSKFALISQEAVKEGEDDSDDEIVQGKTNYINGIKRNDSSIVDVLALQMVPSWTAIRPPS